jgi:predicted permease
VIVSLASTLTPLALAAVGFALRIDRIAGRLSALALGVGHRLILAPLSVLLVYLALGALDPVGRVAVFEMAMPPMLGASIIAMDHNLEPDLVALLIGVGVPLSMLTTPIWWTIVSAL